MYSSVTDVWNLPGSRYTTQRNTTQRNTTQQHNSTMWADRTKYHVTHQLCPQVAASWKENNKDNRLVWKNEHNYEMVTLTMVSYLWFKLRVLLATFFSLWPFPSLNSPQRSFLYIRQTSLRCVWGWEKICRLNHPNKHNFHKTVVECLIEWVSIFLHLQCLSKIKNQGMNIDSYCICQ